MGERLLVQSKASINDPRFADQIVHGVPFLDYFREAGIKVLQEETVVSCHGHVYYSIAHADQMERLVDTGHRVVSVQAGGLLFARPSLEAAMAVSVPIISVPLDPVAFLAPYVPSGTAAIAGVGINRYETAAYAAKEILLRQFPGVNLMGKFPKLERRLEDLHVPILGYAAIGQENGLAVGELSLERFHDADRTGTLALVSSAIFNPEILAPAWQPLRQTLYLRGEDNIAFFAAKIMAAYNQQIRQALHDASLSKMRTYQSPKLSLDAFA